MGCICNTGLRKASTCDFEILGYNVIPTHVPQTQIPESRSYVYLNVALAES